MLEPCAKFSQLLWKTISIDLITFQVMDLIGFSFLVMLRRFAAFVIGPRGPTLRLLGSPRRVLAETVSRFVDQIVYCVPF